MYPPVYQTLAADAAVKNHFGASKTRIYPAGQAVQGGGSPYAVHQLAAGSPANYLAEAPDVDSYLVQFDIYADTARAARNAAQALRDAIEPLAYVTSWRGETRDPGTRLYRYSFDVSWHTHR